MINGDLEEEKWEDIQEDENDGAQIVNESLHYDELMETRNQEIEKGTI